MKYGMSRDGRRVGGVEYLRQRIQDVILTIRGTVPLARGYGSDFHKLIDENVTSQFIADATECAIDMFKNPVNGLDDCQFKGITVNAHDDKVTLSVRVTYEGEVITFGDLLYG